MRISDWSSDVCSSDLRADVPTHVDRDRRVGEAGGQPGDPVGVLDQCLIDREPGTRHVGREHVEALELERDVAGAAEIGRASCRERVCQYVSISVVAESFKKQRITYKGIGTSTN